MQRQISRRVSNRSICVQEALERRTLFSGGLSIVPLPNQWVSEARFLSDTAPHALEVTFSQDVSQTLDPSDLVLINAWSRQAISQDAMTMHYDHDTNRATFYFPGLEDQILPDGQWHATLLSEGVFGPGGEDPSPADFTFEFFFLQGDANGDGSVDLNDFNIVAKNFGQNGVGYAQGDLNYDGLVDRLDFDILAARLGNRIGTPGEPVGGPIVKTVPVSKDSSLGELLS